LLIIPIYLFLVIKLNISPEIKNLTQRFYK